MARLLVLYKTPKDPAAFDKHYFEVHIPLAKMLPGLRKYEVSHGDILSPTGANGFYLIATLHFDDLEALKQARTSEIGKACAADRLLFAPDNADLLMFLFDDRTV